MEKKKETDSPDELAAATPRERFAVLQAAAVIYTGGLQGNAAETPATAVAAALAMLALIP